MGIYIQSNQKQLLGAKIAKHAIETRGGALQAQIPVTIIEVEKQPAFQAFVGSPYRIGYAPYTFDDLQSFTLTRFMPPELMHYQGRALVIDPDIFALKDITTIFNLPMGDAAIAACSKHGAWDTSVMLLECEKLTHWRIGSILEDLASRRRVYEQVYELRDEQAHITELERIWNSLDAITPETKFLHTTKRLTQPWKTGLSVDFTFNPIPKLFGIIPRFWVHHPTHYQPHPDAKIESLFFELARDALAAGAISTADVRAAITARAVRADLLDKIIVP